MVTRNIQFAAKEHYHVYNRGNSKQVIFRQPSDYLRFLQLLYLANNEDGIVIRDVLREEEDVFAVPIKKRIVTIHAYCLMSNHYHLLLSPLTDDGLSKFMLKVGTGYSMYFNTKYDRTGSLFEGRYQAKHADFDEYLKYLFSYIHLNPISKNDRFHKNSFEKALRYPYSSMAIYFGQPLRRAALCSEKIVDTALLSTYLPDLKSRQEEILDWLNFDPDFLM